MAVMIYMDGGHALGKYEQVAVITGPGFNLSQGEVFLRSFGVQVREGQNDRIFPWEAVQQVDLTGRSAL